MEETNTQANDQKGVDKGFLATLGVSYALGVGLGFGGRTMGIEWILPTIPPTVALCESGLKHMSKGRWVCYAAYGLGVATAHADRLFQATKSLLENF